MISFYVRKCRKNLKRSRNTPERSFGNKLNSTTLFFYNSLLKLKSDIIVVFHYVCTPFSMTNAPNTLQSNIIRILIIMYIKNAIIIGILINSQ